MLFRAQLDLMFEPVVDFSNRRDAGVFRFQLAPAVLDVLAKQKLRRLVHRSGLLALTLSLLNKRRGRCQIAKNLY